MHDSNIVLNNGIPSPHINPVSLGQSVPARKPEQPAAADHRHLPHRPHRRVAAEHRQHAAIILSHGEVEVHRLQEPQLLLRSTGVHPLGAPDARRVRVRARSQPVVHHGDHAKHGAGRGVGGARDADGSRVAAADDVVEVEMEVAQLLLLLQLLGLLWCCFDKVVAIASFNIEEQEYE